MQIRRAQDNDLGRILKIYEDARRLMETIGNPGQWKSGYPQRELIMEDIERGRLYTVVKEAQIVGVFAFTEGPEPEYDTLRGTWRNDAPYRVIHRLAASGAKGVAAAVFDWAKSRTDNLRIDTHAQNAIMRHLIEKQGFHYVGDITLSDGSPRRAYHWLKTE